MFLRIYFIVVGLLALYFGYGIYNYSALLIALHDVPPAYSYTNEQADLKLVEFLDYNCEYCREAHQAVTEAVARDGKILYMPRPVILNQKSIEPGLFLYAAGAQGKFAEAHEAMIKGAPPADHEEARLLASRLGLDQAAMEAFRPEAETLLKENMRVLLEFGAEATPYFMIGTQIFYSPQTRMPTAEDFLTMFKQARSLQ